MRPWMIDCHSDDNDDGDIRDDKNSDDDDDDNIRDDTNFNQGLPTDDM